MNNKSILHQDIVLIVDDTPANHEVIQSFLSDIDVACENAFDGMEAITMCSAAAKDHYTLILMDINLPHMNGFETTSGLRKLGITAPVIAVTATSKEDERIDNAREIFDSLLFKPFNASAFFSAISPYIQNAVLHSLEANGKSDGATMIAASTAGRANAPDDVSAAAEGICNFDKAIENMGNNLRLFTKHFNNFKKNNADLALRLDALLRQGALMDAAALCHSIKGLAGMLGLVNLCEHIIALEQLLLGALQTEPASIDTANLLPTISTFGKTMDFSHDKASYLLTCIGNDIRLICQTEL